MVILNTGIADTYVVLSGSEANTLNALIGHPEPVKMVAEHIRRLRKKVDGIGMAHCIVTERGQGYRLAAEVVVE